MSNNFHTVRWYHGRTVEVRFFPIFWVIYDVYYVCPFVFRLVFYYAYYNNDIFYKHIFYTLDKVLFIFYGLR